MIAYTNTKPEEKTKEKEVKKVEQATEQTAKKAGRPKKNA